MFTIRTRKSELCLNSHLHYEYHWDSRAQGVIIIHLTQVPLSMIPFFHPRKYFGDLSAMFAADIFKTVCKEIHVGNEGDGLRGTRKKTGGTEYSQME